MTSQEKTLTGIINRFLGGCGAIDRCPECNRVVEDDYCVVHMDVEPEKDLRVKIKLSGGEKIVIGSEKLVEIINLDVEEAHILPQFDLMNIIRKRLKDEKVRVFVNTIDSDSNLFYAKEIDFLDD